MHVSAGIYWCECLGWRGAQLYHSGSWCDRWALLTPGLAILLGFSNFVIDIHSIHRKCILRIYILRQGWHSPASIGIAKLEYPFSSVLLVFVNCNNGFAAPGHS